MERIIMRLITALLLILSLSSCTSTRCYSYRIMGADEFVCDSYRIQQGKNAILEMEGKTVLEITEEDLEEYQDRIVEDDILMIMVYHPKREDLKESFKFINEHGGGFRVHNGMVEIPDIPPVEVAGLAIDEAREKIQEQYREHIQNVTVYLSYKQRLQRRVELAGMIGASSLPVDGRVRLFELLSQARIAPGSNLFMSYVLRDGEHLGVDIHRLMNLGDMSQNIVMRGGDKVFIAPASDARVMVMGEVNKPSPVNVPYGSISLREAIVSAGGIPFTGDRRNIQVIRGNLECPKIYVLTWDHIIQLPNDSLLLMPGDTVFISEKPITQWNRFIAQLMPSLYSFQTGYGVYKIVSQN